MIKSFYLKEIERIIPIILESQQDNGSFSDDGQHEIINARFQEAVLTLAWYQKMYGKNLSAEIERGIDFWIKLQNTNGSFPEHEGESFSATAFSCAAIAKAVGYCDISNDLCEKLFKCFSKAVAYFSSKFQKKRTNQQIAAYFALKEMSKYVCVDNNIFYKIEDIIRSNTTESGFFLEDDGVDLGYNSLSCEMLYLCGKEEFCENFVNNLKFFVFPDGTFAADFSRTKGWILIDFLEMFSGKHEELKKIRDKLIRAHKTGICDVFHLIDKRHIMTDGYRVCFAYDYTDNAFYDGNLVLPCDDKHWDKLLPEDILIVRMPKYMAVIYMISKIGSVLWFDDGVVVNLSKDSSGSSIVCDGANYSFVKTRSISYEYNRGRLRIISHGTPFFSVKLSHIGEVSRRLTFTALLKSVISLLFQGGRLVKEFTFHENWIDVKVISKNGVERVPALGSILLPRSFLKHDGVNSQPSLFYKRNDYHIYERSYSKELSYKLGIVD